MDIVLNASGPVVWYEILNDACVCVVVVIESSVFAVGNRVHSITIANRKCMTCGIVDI